MMASAISNEEVPIVRGSSTATACLLLSRDQGHLLSSQSAHLPPLNQQELDLASATKNLKCVLQSKAVPTFFFKEPLVFPLLAEARALCLATNRLPTSRCAQSIHPHSSKRKGLGREQAAWSPPTLFTQINEQSLSRNVFSSPAVEAMLWPVTHPLPAGLEENLGFMIKDCFPLCASSCGTTQLEQWSSFKLF